MPDDPHGEVPVDLTVIVCVRNGAATIRRQLDALDRQVDHSPFEVVIVDNASTDATRSVVEEWIATRRHAAADVRLISGPRKPGIPATRNVGALAARGRVLAFCDADDEVDEKWVGAMVRAVDDEKLVGGRILARAVDGAARPELFSTGLMQSRYLPHVSGCNWSISRTAYFAVGGFDESLPRYGFDDVDFSWRVQEAGFALEYVEEAVVHFTVSDGRASLRKRIALGRGRVLMASRYPAYDPRVYTVRGSLRDLIVDGSKLAVNALRTRRINRARFGHFAALLGRSIGAIQYRGGRRLPDRKLLGGGSASNGS